MVVLLPEARGALPEREKSLKPEMVEKLIQDLHPRQVVVSLPRFTIEATLELKQHLKAAGMVAAFGNKADFLGITTEKELSIDQVFHKAWVKVEEKGAEATAVIMRPTSALRPEELVIFRADHSLPLSDSRP